MKIIQNELLENMKPSKMLSAFDTFGVQISDTDQNNYIAIRISGNGMKTKDARSIPDKSLILLKELKLELEFIGAEDIPVNTPVCLELYDPNTGKIIRCIRIISLVCLASGRMLLSCYDSRIPDAWVYFEHIHRLWTVEGISKPDIHLSYNSIGPMRLPQVIKNKNVNWR